MGCDARFMTMSEPWVDFIRASVCEGVPNSIRRGGQNQMNVSYAISFGSASRDRRPSGGVGSVFSHLPASHRETRHSCCEAKGHRSPTPRAPASGRLQPCERDGRHKGRRPGVLSNKTPVWPNLLAWTAPEGTQRRRLLSSDRRRRESFLQQAREGGPRLGGYPRGQPWISQGPAGRESSQRRKKGHAAEKLLASV